MYSDKRLIKLARDLIHIDSQNPPGNEKEIAFFIRGVLAKSGLATRLVECGKNRFSTITVLRARRPKATLLLTPHLDTVPFGRHWKFPPLSGRLYKKRIYGRGATDCKGNLTVGLEVMRSLAEEKAALDYTIVFAATADEEAGSYHGLIPLLKRKIVSADYAVILDSDEFNIIIAQKGLLHVRVSLLGKKAHGAYPERGINAIELGTEFIKRVRHLSFPQRKHALLRPPTINVGTIHGGDKVNMVADWCQIELDIRYLPHTHIDVIIKQLKQAIHAVCRSTHGRLEIIAQQDPCHIDASHVLVRSLTEASKKTLGSYRLKGSEGATVMTLLDKHGIPTVATGFGSTGCAHTSNEYVVTTNLIKGYHMLRNFLMIFNTHVTSHRRKK